MTEAYAIAEFKNREIDSFCFGASCMLGSSQKSAQPAASSKAVHRLLFVVCSHSIQQTGSGSTELEHNSPQPRLQHFVATCKMFPLLAAGRWVGLELSQLFYDFYAVTLLGFFPLRLHPLFYVVKRLTAHCSQTGTVPSAALGRLRI